MSCQQQKRTPLIALRMKSSRSSPPSERQSILELDEVSDQVMAMMLQEESATYKCRDYLERRKAESKNIQIDSLCREKMCEWSFRVVDHFHASREIVAIAFSYLDRFVDRCCCDRTAFKLAAMTSVYMATKIFNSREISIRSLAELSRGEFDMQHIGEMETIILQTLDWRMQPPTAQCFINAIHGFLPSAPAVVTRAIYSRATFFAELSLFDYSFITQPRSAIAIATLLNAMDGLDENVFSPKDQAKFLESLKEMCGLDHSKEVIDSIRNRLWYIYSQSAQFQDDDVIPPSPLSAGSHATIKRDSLLGGDQSPVCVSVVSAASQ